MYKISKLKNKINLITVPLKNTKALTVLVLVPVGARYETAHLSGASHFTEHMMFKGTAKRPTAQDISRALDAVGAQYNAFTSKDYTGYYVKIENHKQELAFDLLSDMLFNSKFDVAEIEKEKGVIVEEIRMYEDNPTMGIGMLYDQALYGNCPLGRDEGGTIKTVRALSRTDLFNYYQAAYRPENMVLVVAGALNKKTVSHLCYFLEKKPQLKNIHTIHKDDFEKFSWPKNKLPLNKRVLVKEKKLDQTHLIIGFPGLPLNHKDRYAAAVLLNILGGGMSSRLFTEVREKRGLAYMIHAGSSAYRDTGSLYIQAGLDSARLKEAIAVIKEELHKIAGTPVLAKELEDAKNNFSGHLTLSMEESNALAQWFAKQFWFSKEMETYEQSLKKIHQVTAADVLRVAKQVFKWEEARAALIGDTTKEKFLTLMR